jgi:DNA-binding NarL/FixJ family response regulator
MQKDREGRVKLSRREAQLLALITEGLSSKEIAGRMKITENTVAGYRQRLNGGLGQSRGKLIVWGTRHPEALAGEWAVLERAA